MAITLNNLTGATGAGVQPSADAHVLLAEGASSMIEGQFGDDLTYIERTLDLPIGRWEWDFSGTIGAETSDLMASSRDHTYTGVINARNIGGIISVNRLHGREGISRGPDHYILYGDLSHHLDRLSRSDIPHGVYWIVNAVESPETPSAFGVENEAEFVPTFENVLVQADENGEDTVAEPKLHAIAAEFERGVEDELPPIPDAVVIANQLVTMAERKAKNHQFSVDVDGGMSFIIVPDDGTLISGELTTGGNIYAWHYDTDWKTELGNADSIRDFSSLLGWLG